MATPNANNDDGAKRRCIFYDVKHSNNSARIRLWLRLGGGLEEHVKTIMLGHDDLDQGAKLKEVNPLKKIPAFVTDTGLNALSEEVGNFPGGALLVGALGGLGGLFINKPGTRKRENKQKQIAYSHGVKAAKAVNDAEE